jgi:hypothetical protein
MIKKAARNLNAFFSKTHKDINFVFDNNFYLNNLAQKN